MIIFQNLLSTIASTTFSWADWLINNIFLNHPFWFSLTGFSTTLLILAGRRVASFNHPDKPLLSPVLRVIGRVTRFFGKILGACTLVLALALAGLIYVGSAASAESRSVDGWPVFEENALLAWHWVQWPVMAMATGLAAGGIFGLYLMFRTIPLFERGQGLRDVRTMQRLFRRMRQFSPLDYINIKKGIFIGLEDGRRPVHIPLRQLRETHVQILGASGGAKGISLGVLGYQFVIAGECTIVFDPKGDRRLPLVLAAAAKRANVQFHYIDLNPTAPPQFNLLAGATSHEVEELLVGGLGLAPSSGDGNYYRGLDQDAAQRAAGRADECSTFSMPDLLQIVVSDEAFHEADNFVRRLRQVCDLPAIHTNHDIDLPGIVERGEVLYIRGSTDNHRVKALQAMLLIRLLQVIKARGESARKVALILDEFKHLLCQVSLDSLGTVRELSCHAILAHQSMGDLGGVPGMRREDVEPRVVDNTTIKLVFRIGDEKTSADFAAKSGKQRTHAEGVRGVDEDGHDQRSWTETQQFRMSEDLFTHLHRPTDGKEVVAAGVLFGFKSARLLAVSPINVTGKMPEVTAAPVETCSIPKQPESLI